MLQITPQMRILVSIDCYSHTDDTPMPVLDASLPHTRTARLWVGELFELKCDLLLYDISSTHFEGDLQGCPLAKRGYSRDSRPERPQVCEVWLKRSAAAVLEFSNHNAGGAVRVDDAPRRAPSLPSCEQCFDLFFLTQANFHCENAAGD
jgi:hypothetical protein